jgi:hypothetical protein
MRRIGCGFDYMFKEQYAHLFVSSANKDNDCGTDNSEDVAEREMMESMCGMLTALQHELQTCKEVMVSSCSGLSAVMYG